jgi:hypothetical protein
MEIGRIPRTEFSKCTVSDRLRWTSDFLNVAGKAIRVVACAQGLEYPCDLHRIAQQDLRTWARFLDDHPSIAAEFEAARVTNGVSVADRGSAELGC